jgi:hypothetical protein
LANGHGGYRKPTNPAPVSGPGAHSQRTDGQPVMGGLGDGSYGDETAMEQIQGGAPMAAAPGTPSGPPPGPHPALAAMQGLTPLDAPSQQPGVPVTDGADAGAGAGSTALGMVDPNRADAQYLKKYLPTFVKMANSDDTPPGFKQWVRNVIANI